MSSRPALKPLISCPWCSSRSLRDEGKTVVCSKGHRFKKPRCPKCGSSNIHQIGEYRHSVKKGIEWEGQFGCYDCVNDFKLTIMVER